MKKHVIIGSRGSRLAEIQARSVLDSLASIHPDVDFSLAKITTRGDRRKIIPLHQISGHGVFVKEVQEALLEGRIDLAVHSLKDLPLQAPEGLSLAAVTERLDPRDVLISRGSKLNELASGSTIGTGSPRRAAQLLTYRPDLKVQEMRGNIDTRLRKLSNSEVDGIIVATAAMIRLGWEDKITEYLPVEHFLPQAGQGALGIEVRTGDDEMLTLVQPLQHKTTWQSITAERIFLQAMGGGCSTVTASLGTITGNTLRLQGMIASSDGIIHASEEGNALAPEQVAKRLAQRLLETGVLQPNIEAREQ